MTEVDTRTEVQAWSTKEGALSPTSAFIANYDDGDARSGKSKDIESTNDRMLRRLQKEIEAHENQEQLKSKLKSTLVMPDSVDAALERELAASSLSKETSMDNARRSVANFQDEFQRDDMRTELQKKQEEEVSHHLESIRQKELELDGLKKLLVQKVAQLSIDTAAAESKRLDFEHLLEQEVRNKLQQEVVNSSDPTRAAVTRMEEEAKKRQIKKAFLESNGKSRDIDLEQKIFLQLEEKDVIEKAIARLEKKLNKMKSQVHERSSSHAMKEESVRRAQLKAEGKWVDPLTLPVPEPKPPAPKVERHALLRLEEEKQRRAALKAQRAAEQH